MLPTRQLLISPVFLEDIKKSFAPKAITPEEKIETIMYNAGIARLIHWIDDKTKGGTL